MLKYPSVQATKGEGAQVLVAEDKPRTDWFGKVKTGNLAAFFESRATRGEHYTLNWKEFTCIAFCLEWPVIHIANYVDLIVHWGGMMVLIGYFVFAIGSSIPLLMLLLFLGSYTKRGYMRLWEMIPILKGMAWTVSMFSIALEFFNVSIAGLASMYLSDLFHMHVPWQDCSFKEATNSCYPMFPKKPYTANCCLENCDEEEKFKNIVHFPAYEYFMKNKIKAPDSYGNVDGTGILQGQWVSHVCLAWFIIFLLSSLGFQKFRGTMTTASTIFAFIFFVPTVGIIIFISGKYSVPAVISSKFITITYSDFWIDILSHSFSREIPGNFVLLGSIAPADMVPNGDVFNIYILKLLFLIIIMIWLSIGIQVVQIHYKIKHVACIPIDGLILLFALIPDILTRFPLPQIPLILWFLGIWFLALSSATYTVTAFIDSLIEVLPVIGSIRMGFSAIFCTICCLFNMVVLTSFYFAIEESWVEITYTIVTIVLLLLFSIAIFIYSCNNIVNDFHFTYGKPLADYWINCLKLIALLTSLCICLMLSQTLHYTYRYKPNSVIQILSYVFVVILLMPIAVLAVWNYMKYKNKGNVLLAVTPSEHWGPPSTSKKQARSRFQPSKEFRFRTEDQRCKHNCLLNSQKLKREIKLLAKNQQRLVDIIKNEQTSE